MSTMLLYKKITLLNRDRHRDLKLQPHSSFNFARETHIVPLALPEFYQAARDYPILFIGEKGARVPVILLGLAEKQNSFVDAQGKWLDSTYVPAFIRRYPFVLADNGKEQFSVCFDEAHEGWNEDTGEPLFDAEGKNTGFLDEVIQFLQGYTAEMRRTQAFTQKLEALDLLDEKRLELRHASGERFVVNDFLAVDEERLKKLEDEQILELQREGFLGAIYAHLISLGSANRLFDRHIRMREEKAEQEETPFRQEASEQQEVRH